MRKFGAADAVALICAAIMALVFVALHRSGLGGAAPISAPLVITAAFALLALVVRGVNWSGAAAGFAVAMVLAMRDLRMFWILLAVFTLTAAATRAGRSRKQKLRAAEASSGRSASQVMANLGIAGLIAVLSPQGWQLLVLAALAEAAADTCSSEAGMAFPGKTVLLTSWQPVPAGVDGGITVYGTVASLVAAGAIAAAAAAFKLVTHHQAAAIAIVGFLGALVDSLLGALWERRGYLNNDMVNLLSTAAAVGMIYAIM